MQYENNLDQLKLDHKSLLSSDTPKLNLEIFLPFLERWMDNSVPNSFKYTGTYDTLTAKMQR